MTIRQFWEEVVGLDRPLLARRNGVLRTDVEMSRPYAGGHEPQASVESIDIFPENATLDVGEEQHFMATAAKSDRTHSDMTDDVEWTATPPGIIAIDKNGVAVAQHATGTVTITARDPVSGHSKSVTAVVKRKEMPQPTPQPAAPVLQWITIAPARVSGFVNEWKEFTAIGHYTDGTKVNLTSEVEWSSFSMTTDPVLDEPLVTHHTVQFPLRRVGGATITAKFPSEFAHTGDIAPATASVTVTERVQPPPPPAPH